MMTRRCAVLLALALSSGVAARAGDGPIQIVSRAIVDPRTGSAQAGRVVVVEDGRIREVRQGTPVDGIPVLDLSTAYLLPGLYDVHTHLCSRIDAGGRSMEQAFERILLGTLKPTAYRSIQGVVSAREMLEAGFTTVRDVGNAGDWADVALKEAIGRGLVPGPSLDISGKIIAPYGGQFPGNPDHPDLGAADYLYADTADEIRKAIRLNLHYGANWIKIVLGEQRHSYSAADLALIVSEAHAAGVKVAAHAGDDDTVRLAAEAGVDSIEHATRASLETLKLLRERGIVLVGTDFSRSVLAGAGLPEEFVEDRHRAQLARLARARQAGVALAFGSDVFMDVAGHTRGTAALLMLDTWIEGGMSGAEILRAMITTPAALLDDQKKRGAIEAGFEADIIATRENPLANPATLSDVVFVMKRGRIVRDPVPGSPGSEESAKSRGIR